MVSVPALIPVTTPEVILAFILEALQVPPVTVSDSVIVAETQTLSTPVIEPTIGKLLIYILLEVLALPHMLVTVYVMVSIPE